MKKMPPISERLSPREVAALWDMFMEEHFPVSARESLANAEDIALLLAEGKRRLFAPKDASDTEDTYVNKYQQFTKGIAPGEASMQTNNLWNLFRPDRQEVLESLFRDARPDPRGHYKSVCESDGRIFTDEIRQTLWEPQLYYLQKSGLLKQVFEKLGMRASEEFLKLQALMEQGASVDPEARAKHEAYLQKLYVILADMGITMSSVDG